MDYASYLKKQLDSELMKDREGHITITITKTGFTKKQDCKGRLEFAKDVIRHVSRSFLLRSIDDLLKTVENFKCGESGSK